MEPDNFPPFVLGETVLVQKIAGVVPETMDAKIQNPAAEFRRNIG